MCSEYAAAVVLSPKSMTCAYTVVPGRNHVGQERAEAAVLASSLKASTAPGRVANPDLRVEAPVHAPKPPLKVSR